MSTLYEPKVHPRILQRLESKRTEAPKSTPGEGWRNRVNSRLGLSITLAVGSMWAAYAFTLLALISLPSALGSRSLIVIISWIAQTFLQLVLLPIIIVGQNIQGAASDKRAQATYDDAEALMHDNRQLQAHMLAQDDAIVAILDKLDIPRPEPVRSRPDVA